MSRAVRPSVLAALLAIGLVAGASAPAGAQDDGGDDRAIASDLERLRNNPFASVRRPERVREIVAKLLGRRAPRADAALREMLLDPRTDAVVVAEIAAVTVSVAPHALLDDVVDRIRREPPGSPLDRRLDGVLLRADADVVRRLSELVRDPGRTAAYRVTAIRLLGRTGDAAALPVLAEVWAGPDRELRDAGRLAFDEIVPGAVSTSEEAREFVARLREEDLPLSEALRRQLRERLRTAQQSSSSSGSVTERDYAEIAISMLPKASLDQILRLYVLASPVPDVRAAAARRLATYPYDAEPDPDGRIRAAHALFAALRREDAGAVENAILTTLAALAPSVRGGVPPEDVEAVAGRVRPGGAVGRETRLLATKLAGVLREERLAAPLAEAYAWLGDSDEEARLAILDALQEIPADRTAWLVERTAAERQPRVLRKLVRMLARSESPAATSAFAGLLGDTARADAETRVEAAKALATQWALRSDAAARDALVDRGLADPDPSVRSSAAGALGIDGPDRARSTAALLRVLSAPDPDADVRRTAARSVILLDEARATANLVGRFRDDPAVFEVWRAHVAEAVRRDQAPDRALAAADALVAADLRQHAASVLEVTIDGVPDAPRTLQRLREALARTYLEDGRWEDAERTARALAAATRDDAVRDRCELLLARALTASGEAGRLDDAERRLEALRTAGRLDRASDVEAAATLGDVRLRRGDAIGAIEVLSIDARDAAEPVRRRIALLLADAEAAAAQERTRVLALAESLSGSGGEAARRDLSAPGFAGRAAWHLARELRRTTDYATVRRLLAAAEVVAGSPMPRLQETATPAQIAEAVEAACAALARVPRAAPPRR